MRFLVDAPLPLHVALALRSNGHEAAHTIDLPQGNRSPDSAVVAVADREDRVVVSKDEDFVETHILRGRPAKLLLITTGNIANRDLL